MYCLLRNSFLRCYYEYIPYNSYVCIYFRLTCTYTICSLITSREVQNVCANTEYIVSHRIYCYCYYYFGWQHLLCTRYLDIFVLGFSKLHNCEKRISLIEHIFCTSLNVVCFKSENVYHVSIAALTKARHGCS